MIKVIIPDCPLAPELFLPHAGGRSGWGCTGGMPAFFTPTLVAPLKEEGYGENAHVQSGIIITKIQAECNG